MVSMFFFGVLFFLKFIESGKVYGFKFRFVFVVSVFGFIVKDDLYNFKNDKSIL